MPESYVIFTCSYSVPTSLRAQLRFTMQRRTWDSRDPISLWWFHSIPQPAHTHIPTSMNLFASIFISPLTFPSLNLHLGSHQCNGGGSGRPGFVHDRVDLSIFFGPPWGIRPRPIWWRWWAPLELPDSVPERISSPEYVRWAQTNLPAGPRVMVQLESSRVIPVVIDLTSTKQHASEY